MMLVFQGIFQAAFEVQNFYLFFLVHFIFIREFIFQQALLSEPLNVQVYLVSQSL